jgi:hypothetical protein
MKTLLTLALVAISASLHAQSYSFRIQEDYNESQPLLVFFTNNDKSKEEHV